jgi:hypothetical protein
LSQISAAVSGTLVKAKLEPSRSEFVHGVRKFDSGESWDPMYSLASRLLTQDWGKPRLMAEDVGVLLLTWNNAFYRYGEFDFGRFERVLKRHIGELEGFRARSLLSFGRPDEPQVRSLFRHFSRALRVYEGKAKDQETPVGTAKALHLLAPNFFPLWDQYIAPAYGCRYARNAAATYLRFCGLTQHLLRHARRFRPALPREYKRNLLKRVDEYNYAKFTM